MTDRSLVCSLAEHGWDGNGRVCALCGTSHDKIHRHQIETVLANCACAYDGAWDIDRRKICGVCAGNGFISREILKRSICGKQRPDHEEDEIGAASTSDTTGRPCLFFADAG